MSRAKKPVRFEVYENMSVVHVCNGYSHCVSYQKKRLKLKKKGGS